MIVTRFAPSPTGLLHLGHAYSAWFARHLARQSTGHFLLRIEDIDQGRCRPAYAEAIRQDLSWLGLSWDDEVLVQSKRLALYEEALGSLRRRGLLYPCFCSRQDITREIAGSAAAPHGPDGAALYPGTCRLLSHEARATRLAAGLPHAWRLDMQQAARAAPPLFFLEKLPGCEEARSLEGAPSLPEAPGLSEAQANGLVACNPEAFGDVVLARRDFPGSYHLCVTYDDAAQGVTLVTRGMDLRPATSVHRLLQHLMGWPAPCYAHHRLITGADGRRLAKRNSATTICKLREEGLSPEDVLRLAGCMPL